MSLETQQSLQIVSGPNTFFAIGNVALMIFEKLEMTAYKSGRSTIVWFVAYAWHLDHSYKPCFSHDIDTTDQAQSLSSYITDFSPAGWFLFRPYTQDLSNH